MRRIIIIFIIFFLISTSGCYNVRRKFIRKKKVDKDAPVYVDFKEYPTTISKDAYVDYYLFVRGWLDELLGALNKGKSFKRQRRAIKEALMNIEQIIAFFNNQGKEEIYPFYEELLGFRDRIERSPNMSQIQRNNLMRQVETFKRRFEKKFNYSDIEQWLN